MTIIIKIHLKKLKKKNSGVFILFFILFLFLWVVVVVGCGLGGCVDVVGWLCSYANNSPRNYGVLMWETKRLAVFGARFLRPVTGIGSLLFIEVGFSPDNVRTHVITESDTTLPWFLRMTSSSSRLSGTLSCNILLANRRRLFISADAILMVSWECFVCKTQHLRL